MLTHMGHKFSEEEVEEMLNAADINGDGQLDYEGLLSYSTLICWGRAGVGEGGVGVKESFSLGGPVVQWKLRNL